MVLAMMEFVARDRTVSNHFLHDTNVGFLWLINTKSPWEKRGADGRSNRINESYTDLVG